MARITKLQMKHSSKVPRGKIPRFTLGRSNHSIYWEHQHAMASRTRKYFLPHSWSRCFVSCLSKFPARTFGLNTVSFVMVHHLILFRIIPELPHILSLPYKRQVEMCLEVSLHRLGRLKRNLLETGNRLCGKCGIIGRKPVIQFMKILRNKRGKFRFFQTQS